MEQGVTHPSGDTPNPVRWPGPIWRTRRQAHGYGLSLSADASPIRSICPAQNSSRGEARLAWAGVKSAVMPGEQSGFGLPLPPTLGASGAGAVPPPRPIPDLTGGCFAPTADR